MGRVLKLLLDRGREAGERRDAGPLRRDRRARAEVRRRHRDARGRGLARHRREQHAQRFYDEGEDFWPKRYAIWGRLVAGQPDQIAYSIIDAKSMGKFMPPVFPPMKARVARGARARCSSSIAAALERPSRDSTPRCGPAPSTTRSSTTARTEGLDAAQDALGARRSTRRRSTRYPLRPGITFTYLGVAVDERARMLMDDGKPCDEHLRRGRDHGGQRARQGLPRRHRHGDRHDVRAHRGRGGRAPCPRVSSPASRSSSPRRSACSRSATPAATARATARCFPALERRLAFDERDVHYLANLCHNCGACLYACQYAPPHEFAAQFPARARAGAQARPTRKYAWPAFPRARVRAQRPGRRASSLLLSLALFFAFTAWSRARRASSRA